MGTPKNLVGMRVGKLTVISRAGSNRSGKAMWNCLCDCGNETTVCTNNLTSGRTNSCGCLVKKHGYARKERLYNIWVGMRQRCRDKNSKDYKRYGARGIRVCDEWQSSYLPFRQWAIENGYSDDLSIDRIDDDGNYCPENCRWADCKTQNNNLRSNHMISYLGARRTMAEWAESADIPYKTFKKRISRGMSIEDAISKPVVVHHHAVA